MAEKTPALAVWRNEKAQLSLGGEANREPRWGRARRRGPCKVVALALLLVMLAVGGARVLYRGFIWRPEVVHRGAAMNKPQIVTNFKQITPSEKLEWHSCFYENLKCARLSVPMDYNRATAVSGARRSPQVHIALLMVQGRNHTSNGSHSKSPLILNPGGPGGSGVSLAIGAGSLIQQIVGSDQDIIGFDPRGIGQTTPLADCWAFPAGAQPEHPGDVSHDDISRGWINRMIWMLTGWEVLLVNSTKESLEKLNRRARVVGDLCHTKDELYGEDSILRHVSTPAVATDMLSIVDAWDAWREEERAGNGHILAPGKSPEEAKEDSNLDTKGKLLYWGFSYGSLLGATFAAMFPDRVGRVILDGVVDADFYVAPIWTGSLRDTDAVEASLFRHCHEAGPRCAIYRKGDSEADIRARVYNIITKLKNNPIHGISTQTHTPVILTYEILKSIMFSSLYDPTMAFPWIAHLLDLFYREDVAALMRVFAMPASYAVEPYCAGHIPSQYQTQDVQMAIMCSDKRYPLNETLPDLQTRFEEMANVSSYADVWMTLMIGCSGWSITATDPPMRWDDHPSHRQKPIKTSFPLLFISNTADPVTPLYAGVKMARKFVDAGFIEQLSEGHCSISSRSLCTMKKIKDYLSEGKVPAAPEWGPDGREIPDGKWERCETEDEPWMPFALKSEGLRHASEARTTEEARMLNALREVNEFASRMKFWGMKDAELQVDWALLRSLEGERRRTLTECTWRSGDKGHVKTGIDGKAYFYG